MMRTGAAFNNEQSGLIWCYTDNLSFEPGDDVHFRVSCKSERFSIEIARIGLERKVVYAEAGIAGAWHPIPENAYETGCEWPIAHTYSLPRSLSSGYYQVLVKADEAEGRTAQSEHFFVVRPGQNQPKNKILFVLSTNTYHAYNSWGGGNLYSFKDSYAFHTKRKPYRVSTRRPFEPGLLSKYPGAPRTTFPPSQQLGPREQQSRPYLPFSIAEGIDYWTVASGFSGRWEEIFVQFLEKNNYAVDYITQYDLNQNPGILDSYKLCLSVGHDEYWSWKEREAIETWVEGGGNFALFSGNSIFWQVRFEDDGRTMVCYKNEALTKDPVVGTGEEKYTTTMWSSSIIGRPENTLTGLSFTRGGYARTGMTVPRGSGGYTVYRPEHWAFQGTGLEYGDVLGATNSILGYECDGCAFTFVDGRPEPTGEDGSPKNMEILAISPVTNSERLDQGYNEAELLVKQDSLSRFAQEILGEDNEQNRDRFRYGHAMIVAFDKGKGKVFNSGNVEWAFGLTGNDPFVEIITKNVIDTFTK
ncbi:N,N-dimethylformamidase beta subunit family domain-containing protein [Brevibacillus sp. B_LB10_24]|uniref:N,N-dimethylformamidase beta subunit family domain-containing protein n=1 Tax=Brevibacillus sp. B_LB10_24 TaxID=3380645 RepID=UPI0038BB3EBD